MPPWLAGLGRRLGQFLLAFVPALVRAFAATRRSRAADIAAGAKAQRDADADANARIEAEARDHAAEIHGAPPETMDQRLDRWRRGGAL